MNFNTDVEVPLITLVGPPNSGKTTLFNILSGKNYKTANYPGSTVEYYTSRVLSKYNIRAELLDSPGLVSLVPESLDEKITVESLYNPTKRGISNLLINTVDASQLSRHLLLSSQLLKSSFKVILVLTMNDILNKKGIKVSAKKLSAELGCDVILFNGRTKEGLENLLQAINRNLDLIKSNGKEVPTPYNLVIQNDGLINAFLEIERIVGNVLGHNSVEINVNLAKANKDLKVIQPILVDNGLSPDELTIKIDRVLLHRIWGFLIFILVMGLTFTSIFWLAQPLMDFVDNLFSDLNRFTVSNLEPGWLTSMLSDGLISGTGAVLVFVPQIVILFFNPRHTRRFRLSCTRSNVNR